MEPCTNASYPLQLVIAVFSGLSTLLGVWLAHRRKQTERKRSAFYATMLDQHKAWSKFREYQRSADSKGKPE